MSSRIINHTWSRILLFVIITIPIMLLMPSISTVLFPQFKSDYAVFTTIGYGWLNGKIPYLELFDHKGPLVFFIQLIALSLHIGKWAIWIFEIIVAVISFELIFRIGLKLRISLKYNIMVIIITMISYFCYVDGGNSVEEWSLPFQLIVLYKGIKILMTSNQDMSSISKAAFISGICFGVVTMIRINNNCIICGVVIGLIIYLIKHKKFSLIWRSSILFILGIIIAIMPFLIYFASYRALDDMYYATFVFNWLYKQAWPSAPFKATLVMLLPCIALPFTAFIYDKKTSSSLFITCLSISLITFLTFCNGKDYGHYFLMVVPVTALALATSYTLISWQKILVIAYLLYPAYMFRNRPTQYLDNIHKMQYESSLTKYNSPLTAIIAETIPEDERDNIYTYGAMEFGGSLYELGVSPVGKYSFFQNRYIYVDPKIRDSIKQHFVEATPKWIIASEDINKEGIFDGLVDCYEIQYIHNPEIRIYKKVL